MEGIYKKEGKSKLKKTSKKDIDFSLTIAEDGEACLEQAQARILINCRNNPD
jgi:hypothetical protein